MRFRSSSERGLFRNSEITRTCFKRSYLGKKQIVCYTAVLVSSRNTPPSRGEQRWVTTLKRLCSRLRNKGFKKGFTWEPYRRCSSHLSRDYLIINAYFDKMLFRTVCFYQWSQKLNYKCTLMALAIRDILEAQIAYLQNTRPFQSYTPIAVATRLRGYVEYAAASKLLPLA